MAKKNAGAAKRRWNGTICICVFAKRSRPLRRSKTWQGGWKQCSIPLATALAAPSLGYRAKSAEGIAASKKTGGSIPSVILAKKLKANSTTERQFYACKNRKIPIPFRGVSLP